MAILHMHPIPSIKVCSIYFCWYFLPYMDIVALRFLEKLKQAHNVLFVDCASYTYIVLCPIFLFL